MQEFVKSDGYSEMTEEERQGHIIALQSQMNPMNDSLNDLQNVNNPQDIIPQINMPVQDEEGIIDSDVEPDESLEDNFTIDEYEDDDEDDADDY